jgi:hypothetical protein
VVGTLATSPAGRFDRPLSSRPASRFTGSTAERPARRRGARLTRGARNRWPVRPRRCGPSRAPGPAPAAASGTVPARSSRARGSRTDLPGGDWDAGRLPPAVLSVAGQALRSAEGHDSPGEVALARALTRSGTWVVLHARPW